jgi:hypothetical protein
VQRVCLVANDKAALTRSDPGDLAASDAPAVSRA